MLNTQEAIKANYENLCAVIEHQLKELQTKINRMSIYRMSLLVAEILAVVFFVKAKGEWMEWLSLAGLLAPVVLFILAVKRQQALQQQCAYQEQLLWVYQNELALIAGGENGYDQGSAFEDEQHPYLADLDIFGSASLFEKINRCATVRGNKELAHHLSEPVSLTEILSRQEAVREVGEHLQETFAFRAHLREHDVVKIEQIKDKLHSQLSQQLKFTHQPLLRNYVKIIPYLMIPLSVLAVLVGDRWWGALVLCSLFHALLTFLWMRPINKVYVGFSGGAQVLAQFAAAIRWSEDRSWRSTYIQAWFGSEKKVSDQIRSLSAIIQAFDARLNILLSVFLNVIWLWDLRCCIRLDEWHRRAALNVQEGLNRIGKLEELISLATLAYNHPTWTYPTIEQDFTLTAEALAHPLIPQERSIPNHFALSKHPTVDIITGSNMAGKSTFLRTVGANMVLAYTGAVVSASVMRLSVFHVITYMRIKDSLNESTSTFKAELNRLKMILTEVHRDPKAFVLIDEMLRGTNSKDKYMGSKVFVEKLVELKIPALVATHDLQLSELEEVHPSLVRNFHFDIHIEAGEMHFDYLMKEGACNVFNAAILLKEIGLEL